MAKKLTTAEFQELVLKQFQFMHSEFAYMRSEFKDIKDVLYPLARAFDIDTQTLVEHGRQISRIEGHLGFK